MGTSNTPSPYTSGGRASRADDGTGVNRGNFFTSRKNMVGMSLGVLVIMLHVILIVAAGTGLGYLWPVVAAAAWGAGVALTPPEQPKALPAPEPQIPQHEELEKDLKACLRELYRAEPPADVRDQARELEKDLLFVLSEWDDLEGSPEHRLTVWNIIKIYLPEVIRTYLGAPQFRDAEAVAVMKDSLATLTGAAHRIKAGILDQNLRALDSQARTLRETFGNLPGLDYS